MTQRRRTPNVAVNLVECDLDARVGNVLYMDECKVEQRTQDSSLRYYFLYGVIGPSGANEKVLVLIEAA